MGYTHSMLTSLPCGQWTVGGFSDGVALMKALGECPGWTQELRCALSCVALWRNVGFVGRLWVGFWASVGSSSKWLRWGHGLKFGPIIELHLSIGEHCAGCHLRNAHGYYRATPLDRGAFTQVTPAQCSRPCPAGSGQYVGSLTGWGLGRMPGLDAGLALRAVWRRFVVRCWFCGPSLGGVLGA